MAASRRVPFVCLSVLLVVALAPSLRAADSAVDELTKVLPDDVFYFLATGGGAAVEGDFQKSILGRIWQDPSTQSFAGAIRTQLMTKLQSEDMDEDIPQIIALATKYGCLALDRPLVAGFARVETEKGPPACVFAILDAGPRKAELAAAVSEVEAMIGEDEITETEVGSLSMHTLTEADEVPVYWGWVGNYLVFAVNDADGAAAKHVVAPRPAPTDHLKKISTSGDLFAAYYDIRDIWNVVNILAIREGGEHDLAPVRAIFKELGLDKLGVVSARIGFSGSNLVSESFVEAPEPRTGLLTVFKPIDLSLFKTVDAQAVNASACNLDIAAAYDTIMKAVKTVSPDEAYPEIQKGLAEAESKLGFRIREGLISSLAGPVVAYSLPAGKMVEAPMGGGVAVLKLRDPALFEKTMTDVEAFIPQIGGGMLQIGAQTDDEGRTIHVWASPPLAFAQVMPTWSVVGDQVIIGSNTNLCKMAIKKTSADGAAADSLLDTEGFKKVAAGLPENLLSLSYTDSQVMFNQMMMQLQQLWPLAMMGANRIHLTLPVMLPSLGHIAQDMQPGCRYNYVASDGFHARYQGLGLEMSLRDVAVGAFAMGVTMPALARTRQLAFRMTSGTNLSGIGRACLVYANDHDDNFPPDLNTLVVEEDLDPRILVSKRKPGHFDGPSYVYVAGQNMDMYPGNIVAYEDTRYCQEGVNVLFLDSHVEFMKPDEFRRELKETYERLGREMPEIQFADEVDMSSY